MDRKTIILFLKNHLDAYLEAEGFTWLPKRLIYQKRIKEGYLSISISVTEVYETAFVDLHLGVRLNVVENLVSKFTVRLHGVLPEVDTVRVSYGMLMNRTPIAIQYHNPTFGLELAASSFLQFLKQKGISFLNRNSDLYTIDWLINEQPYAPTLYAFSDIHRCFKGAIIARLTNNPEFEFVTQAYKEVLSMDPQSELLLTNFYRMLGYIRPISMN